MGNIEGAFADPFEGIPVNLDPKDCMQTLLNDTSSFFDDIIMLIFNS